MKSKQKLILGATTTFIIVLFTAIVTYALYTSLDERTNKFQIGEIDIAIEEEFTAPENWNGSLVNKVVQIANKTGSDSLVRVSITPRWVNIDGTPFSGDVSENTVKLNFSEYLKDTTIEVPSENWVKGSDGYYYYMTKLKGISVENLVSKTTVLLQSVQIKDGVSLTDDYKGKELRIDVKAEAVQATSTGLTYHFERLWTNVPVNIKEKLKDIVKN